MHSSKSTICTLLSTLRILPSTLHTPHTLHTPLSTLYSPHFSPDTLHAKFYTQDSTLHTAHSIYIPHCTLSTLDTLHTAPTLHTLDLPLHSLHSRMHIVQFTLQTTHSALHCTLRCKLCIANSTVHAPHFNSHFTLDTLHYTLPTPPFPLYVPLSILYTPHPTFAQFPNISTALLLLKARKESRSNEPSTPPEQYVSQYSRNSEVQRSLENRRTAYPQTSPASKE